MSSINNKEVNDTPEKFGYYKEKVKNKILFKLIVTGIFGAVFASLSTGCGKVTANTEDDQAAPQVAAEIVEFPNNSKEVIDAHQYTTYAQVRMQSKTPDNVHFRNDITFHSPKYGAIACGEFYEQYMGKTLTDFRRYISIEKDSALYIQGRDENFDKLFKEICVDALNKSKS